MEKIGIVATVCFNFCVVNSIFASEFSGSPINKGHDPHFQYQGLTLYRIAGYNTLVYYLVMSKAGCVRSQVEVV